MHGTPPDRHCDRSLVESLLVARAYPHPASDPVLVETHISWLILAGEFAYKIKKPLRLDFLDFSDLGKRKFYCEEELRLNAPWAPDIYLDVVPITTADGDVQVGGDGEPVEYALRMRRFDQSARLDQQLSAGKLSADDMKTLGASIAARHLATAPVAPERRDRVLTLIREFMFDNFSAIADTLDEPAYVEIRAWTERSLDLLDARLARRFDEGFVRSCHGDLHLGNLVRLKGGITTFDCIEFNTDLRHIDVMCDTAFLVMDLMARGHRELAARFLNRYLEVTGDYDGMTVFNLYFVYRSMVRAKVAVIRCSERDSDEDRQADINEARFYCDLARRQIAKRRPVLVLMHGLSGSGKTRVSAALMAALPAIRIRSDLERKRMAGLAESADSGSGIGSGIYADDTSRKVYRRLHQQARTMLDAGHSVIIDAAYLLEWQRRDAIDAISECTCERVLIDVFATEEILRNRLLVTCGRPRGSVGSRDSCPRAPAGDTGTDPGGQLFGDHRLQHRRQCRLRHAGRCCKSRRAGCISAGQYLPVYHGPGNPNKLSGRTTTRFRTWGYPSIEARFPKASIDMRASS